ncbi:ABC transporter permease [Kineosporiaceae bacterium SCSIO 59966]|nr:ABC transporter permease [Kineosporiaceae bacterium SCSIO 59966]
MSTSEITRLAALLSEAARATRSQPAVSAVTAIIVASVTAVILATTGQTAAAERQVLDRIDSAGSRTIEISAAAGAAAIPSRVLPVIAQMSSTDWVIGLGVPQDGRNHALGGGAEPLAFWPVVGDLPDSVSLPRRPAVGQAAVGIGALEKWGGVGGLGAVDLPGQRQVPAVGTLSATDSLSFLNDGGIVIADSAADTEVQRIVVAADSAAEVTALTAAVVETIAPTDAAGLRVSSPHALTDLRAAVEGDLGSYGRGLLVAVLAAGLVLVGITALGHVLIRRRDLGRRRALGATRSTIVALVVVQSGYAAASGAVVGAVAGLIFTWRVTGHAPAWSFVAGTAVLAVLGAVGAAVPAAVAAALRDPISVLRTP